MNDTGKKVLVAEDDNFLQKIYQKKLEHEGFTIITANNGIEAVEKTKSELPNIVLLDLMMPQKNGFDALAEIKNDPATKEIPVIVLSNLSQESDIEKVMKLGASDYLIKSNLSLENVLGKIQEHL